MTGHGVRFVAPSRPEELEHGQADEVSTLTVNGLPIDLGKQELLDLLDRTGFQGRYNYLYLPCNYRERTNRGHAFINFCTPGDAKRFFAAWHAARLFGGAANAYGALLNISVCTEQGFESCVVRWTALRLRRLKSADFSPFILGVQ
jgi:hypothetical protein